jgi:peptidoglycan/xylan/chitin deacetylase (PgdA/CDA1 family)
MKLPLSLLLPKIEGVPVLMYHRVWEGISDKLTITPFKLREQFIYLLKRGYCSVSLPEFLDAVAGKISLPPKSILLTFDDGYKTNLTIVYPLLKEFGLKAVFFIIGNTVDNTGPEEKDPANQKMKLAELQKLDPAVVQLALHGYNHISYGNISLEKIKNDLQKNIEVFKKSGCSFHKVLAYPYGERPQPSFQFDALKIWMKEYGIQTAFRIGNKPCKIPVRDIYEIKRIDISGKDSIADFSIKLKKGKLKPF